MLRRSFIHYTTGCERRIRNQRHNYPSPESSYVRLPGRFDPSMTHRHSVSASFILQQRPRARTRTKMIMILIPRSTTASTKRMKRNRHNRDARQQCMRSRSLGGSRTTRTGLVEKQRIVEELDGTVIRVEGILETQVFQYSYIPPKVRSTGLRRHIHG